MDANDGVFAVKAARKTIESEVIGASPEIEFPTSFDEPRGVFVTINTYPEVALRGCIGYPAPVYPLKDALVFSAQSACHDPRFPRLTDREANNCTVEVTILTPPTLLESDKEDLPNNIVIGRDGLMIQFGRRTGLLLPQVPVEYGWDPVEFLEQLCLKANLPIDAWKLSGAEIYSFSGQILHETSPHGDVTEG